MARLYIFAVLSTIMVACHLNIVQGSFPFSLPKIDFDRAADIINDARDAATPIVENFRNLIEKHVEEIKTFRSQHPDLDNNKELSSRFHEIIEDHIKGAVTSHIKKIIDGKTDVKDDAPPTVENFSKLIEKHVNEIKKFRTQHPDIESNKQLSLRINEIIQDHIKRAVSSHIKDKIGEIINSARFSTPTSHTELINNDSRNVNHHDERNENRRKESNDRIRSGNNHSQDRANEKRNDRSHNENHSEDRTNDNRDDRSHNEERKSREQIQSLVHDIAGNVKELKSTIRAKVLAKQAIIESELSKKFDKLREIAKHSALTNYNIGDSTRSPDVARADVHQALRNLIREKFRSIAENKESSEQSFIKAKEELIAAAQKLHGSSNVDTTRSRDDNQGGGTFDFESLKAFKLKLQEMLLKKAQYIREKVALKQDLNQILHNPILANPTNTPSDTQDDVQTVTVSAVGDADALENIAENQAAVGNGGSGGADDDGGSSTAVVLSVLACLVISAAVGVAAVVMWKKHRRHRLYVRIPSGNPVPTTA